ncbi:MAG TPA: hypothetical protein VGZ47_03290, partial [Gemmataceae bacterium]|nr:hypothetical protein [Gemmataceae bacterium]
MTKRNFRPGLEILEGRETPSTVSTTILPLTSTSVTHPTTVIVSTTTVHPAHALAGSGAGTYICTLAYSGVPS